VVRVLIANYQKKKVRLKDVRSIVSEVLREEGIDDGEISIVLSDDKFIQDLNQRYRGVNESTDVLSFSPGPEIPVPRNHVLLGEVIISIERCSRQAKEYKNDFYNELSLLLIHGALHLLGYDHNEEEEDSCRMRKRERELLKKVEGRGQRTEVISE